METLQTRRHRFVARFKAGVDIPRAPEYGGTGGPAVDSDYNGRGVRGSFDYCAEARDEERRVTNDHRRSRNGEPIDDEHLNPLERLLAIEEAEAQVCACPPAPSSEQEETPRFSLEEIVADARPSVEEAYLHELEKRATRSRNRRTG